jgi:hypothetical protein
MVGGHAAMVGGNRFSSRNAKRPLPGCKHTRVTAFLKLLYRQGWLNGLCPDLMELLLG